MSADKSVGNADYNKYLKFNKDESQDVFKLKGDKKLVWYNPDPKEKDNYACGEVVSETDTETVIKTEAGDVSIPRHLRVNMAGNPF